MAKIGWIGLGNMGIPMSKNLLKAGHEVYIWNRTKSKADELLKEGMQWANSPKEIAEKAEYIFTMVSDGPTLQAVTIGKDGVVEGLSAGKVVIDMSTVAPAESMPVNDAIEAKGCKFLRCPVTGSTIPAATGNLGILASGDKATYEKLVPILDPMGKTKFYLGGAEEARVMKIALNTMVGNTTQMLAEAMVLAQKGGIPVDAAMDVIEGGALGNLIIKSKVNLVKTGQYNPAFSVKMIMKDFDLAFDAAKQLGAALPMTAMNRQFYAEAAATGRGDKDYAVLVQLLEENCGIKR